MTDHNNNHDHSHDHDHAEEYIDCLEAIEQLYAYLDGELTDVEKSRFEQHMTHCRSCFTRRELEIELNKKIRQSAGDEVPKTLQSRLKKLIDDF